MKQNRKAAFLKAGMILWAICVTAVLYLREPIPVTDSYRETVSRNCSLIPLKTVRRCLWMLQSGNRAWILRGLAELAGNLILFLPAGGFLPAVFPYLRKVLPYFLTMLLLIFTAETFQLLTLRGIFDVDDIALNLLGSLIGFLLFHHNKKKREPEKLTHAE